MRERAISFELLWERGSSVTLFFSTRLGLVGPSPQRCLHYQDSQGSKLLNRCLVVWPNKKQILSFFQWFFSISSGHRIPLVKDQSNFYEFRSSTIINMINIKAINRVNRKKLNILKIFLKHLEFYIFAYWRWFSPKNCLTNYVARISCL